MRIAITGITGMIGGALAERLRSGGHEVIGVSRSGGPGTIRWDLDAGTLDPTGLAGVDAVVHLAGEPIDGRWTAAKKRRILESRLAGTTLVAETIASMSDGPRVLVSASAIDFYGDPGPGAVTEDDPPGDTFLAGICRRWEDAATPAATAGCRVVHPRTGLVLSRDGGALARMLPLFRFGLGGRLGDGRQIWSWITLHDEVSALEFLLNADVEGPVNLTAPEPVSNREFTDALGAVLHRPTVLPAPAFAMRLVMGEMVDELVLTGGDIRPAVLEAAGFHFAHRTVEDGLRAVLGAG